MVVPARLKKQLRPGLRWGLVWLVPFLVLQSFFLSMFLSELNFLETYPSELVFPLLLNIITAGLIALVIWRLRSLHSLGSRLVTATVLALFATNFDDRVVNAAGLLRTVVPISPKVGADMPFLALILLVVFVFLAWRLGLFVQRHHASSEHLSSKNVSVAVLIVVGVIFMGQWSDFGRIYPDLRQQAAVRPPSYGQASAPVDTSKPDIYYIVLDRYTNGDVLKNDFQYDNTPFYSFLRERGFTVNESAYSNYPYTAMSIASTANGLYTNQAVKDFRTSPVQSRILYHSMVRHSAAFQAIKDSGYSYINLGSWYGTSNKAPLADQDYAWSHILTVFGQSKRLRGLEGIAFDKSIFHQLALTGQSWWPLRLQTRDQIGDTREQLTVLNQLAQADKPGGRLIFAHILVPHNPYYFNADGSLSDYPTADNIGRNVKEKYANQVTFITGQMRDLITNIDQHSGGKSIVLLNADEGPYPQFASTNFLEARPEGAIIADSVLGGSMQDWSDSWLRMKMGILQAVRIPNAPPEDMNHLSAVNIFRIVLNRNFGYQLPYLPDCHFALSAGSDREYNYTDVSQRLLGGSDPACGQFDSPNR